MNRCAHIRSLRSGIPLSILLLALVLNISSFGQTRKQIAGGPLKLEVLDHVAAFNINNIFSYYGNDGVGSYNVFTGNSGFECPKGSGLTAVYMDGFIWGGYHMGRPEPKVGGSMYRHALQAGRIVTPGSSVASGVFTPNCVSDDPTLQNHRVYRVRPDLHPGVPLTGKPLAELTEEASLISRYEGAITAQSLYDAYLRDWNEWPARSRTDPFGMAPFRDLNGDGLYDPAVDIPGQAGAGQTLYYVANDNNSSRTENLANTPPMGMEIHRAIWGYKRGDLLGDVLFSSMVLINKSGYPIDSMYLGQWSDVDVGNPGDDRIGSDTALSLGYAYNRGPWDASYGNTPPAVGSVLFYGPEVPGAAGDSAYSLSEFRRGRRNLGVVAFSPGRPYYQGMESPGERSGNTTSLFTSPRLYELLKGLDTKTGNLYVDPVTRKGTRICFPGDPISGNGWTDADDGWTGWLYGDRSLLLSSGPFHMAAGDTQAVLVGTVIARGLDYLQSVADLKQRVELLRRQMPRMLQDPPPDLHSSVTYRRSGEAVVDLRCDLQMREGSPVRIYLRDPDGTLVYDLPLHDDGVHGDALPSDGIFGGTLAIPQHPVPLDVEVAAGNPTQGISFWKDLIPAITTAGPILLDGPLFFSESALSDARLNSGENIRFGVSLVNGTDYALHDLTISLFGMRCRIAVVGPRQKVSMEYDPSDRNSYFEMNGGDVSSQPFVTMPLRVQDESGNIWMQEVQVPTSALPWATRDLIPERVGEWDAQQLKIRLLDPAQFTGHEYAIQGVDSIAPSGEGGFTLLDLTDGNVILENHPLPDASGHNIPLTDGFRVVRGSPFYEMPGRMPNPTNAGMATVWALPVESEVLQLEGYGGTVGNAHDHWPSGGTPYWKNRPVLVSYARTNSSGEIIAGSPWDTLASFAYRYLFNANSPVARPEFAPFITNSSSWFSYQDYTRSLPFAAYDYSAAPYRRLMVGYAENNVPNGLVDGRYWPPIPSSEGDSARNNQIGSGPREWFFIFDRSYSESPDPDLQVDIWTRHVPLMWVGYPGRRADAGLSSGSTRNTKVWLEAGTAIRSESRWTFQIADSIMLPEAYSLGQNYPNPFNPSTTIGYTLPVPSSVTITIFDLLGREVWRFAPGPQYAGTFFVRWDGTNSTGSPVATGVYFYRFEARGTADPARSAAATNRMILLR